MIIAIDFDGTCVTHDYPKVGSYIGSVPVLRELVKAGHKLILWTMRSDKEFPHPSMKGEQYLSDAINWFKDNGIELWGIQTNPEQKIWTHSPKAYAQLYIDDAALGCPLKFNLILSTRPYADWVKIKEMLIAQDYLK